MSPLMQSMRQFPLRHSLAPLAIFFGTLFLRLIFVGGPPRSDEGHYAFNAQMVWSGARTYPFAPINFYPPLLRWVGMPSATPFLHLRIADDLVAAAAAVMLFLFLARWTEPLIAFVVAAAWSVAANHYIFVDSGFKNSIMAATFVYLGVPVVPVGPIEIRSVLGWAADTGRHFLARGVLSRRVCFLLFSCHGTAGAGPSLHLAGLAIAGFALLLWLYLFRGTPGEVLGYFRGDLTRVFAGWPKLVGYDANAERWVSLRSAVRSSRLAPRSGLVGGLLDVSPGARATSCQGVGLTALHAAALRNLRQALTPYHWAQLVMAIAFLGAMGLNWLSSIDRSPNRWLTIGGFAALAWLAGELDNRVTYRAYRDGFRLSRQFAPVMLWGRWGDPVVDKSLYLEVAKYIRDNTTSNDRIVVSGLHTVLFPRRAAFRRPEPPPDLTFMSEAGYLERRPDLIQFLRQRPPRVV